MRPRIGALLVFAVFGSAAGCARHRVGHVSVAVSRVSQPAYVEAVHYRLQVAEGPFAAMHHAFTELDELYFPAYGVVANVEWEQKGWTQAGANFVPRLNAWYGKSRNYPTSPEPSPVAPPDPAPVAPGEAMKPEPLPPGVVFADGNKPLRPERRVLVPWDLAQAILRVAALRRQQESAAQTAGSLAVRAGLFPDQGAGNPAAPAVAPPPTQAATPGTVQLLLDPKCDESRGCASAQYLWFGLYRHVPDTSDVTPEIAYFDGQFGNFQMKPIEIAEILVSWVERATKGEVIGRTHELPLNAATNGRPAIVEFDNVHAVAAFFAGGRGFDMTIALQPGVQFISWRDLRNANPPSPFPRDSWPSAWSKHIPIPPRQETTPDHPAAEPWIDATVAPFPLRRDETPAGDLGSWGGGSSFVSGRVVDPQGRPLGGIPVYVALATPKGYVLSDQRFLWLKGPDADGGHATAMEYGGSGVTDAAGEFRVDASLTRHISSRDGRVRVIPSHPAWMEPRIVTGEEGGEIRAEPAASLSVRVVDEHGVAVPEFRAVVREAGRREENEIAATNGGFVVQWRRREGVPDEIRASIAIWARGRAMERREVAIPADRDADSVTFALGPVRQDGHLVLRPPATTGADAVRGLVVMLALAERPEDELLRVRMTPVDPDRRDAFIADLPPGRFRVRAFVIEPPREGWIVDETIEIASGTTTERTWAAQADPARR